MPVLLRLTLFDNALAQHPNYRHFVVNSIVTLRALDRHVISDEELIEGAEFTERFGSLSKHAKLEVFEHAPFDEQGTRDDRALLRDLRHETAQMNRVHARLSPVLQMQAWSRGSGARRLRGRAALPRRAGCGRCTTRSHCRRHQRCGRQLRRLR